MRASQVRIHAQDATWSGFGTDTVDATLEEATLEPPRAERVSGTLHNVAQTFPGDLRFETVTLHGSSEEVILDLHMTRADATTLVMARLGNTIAIAPDEVTFVEPDLIHITYLGISADIRLEVVDGVLIATPIDVMLADLLPSPVLVRPIDITPAFRLQDVHVDAAGVDLRGRLTVSASE